nr:KilA-N domain-containing protein [Pseudidiomarina donghaiensis]
MVSNKDGMFDLNDIWRVFVSDKENKRPSEWRSKVRTHLNHTANLRVGHTHDDNGYNTNHTWATLEALYAYAMWVDVKFYMVVVEAFTALTRGDTEEAKRIANQCVSVRNKLREHHDAFTGQDLTGRTSWAIIQISDANRGVFLWKRFWIPPNQMVARTSSLNREGQAR